MATRVSSVATVARGRRPRRRRTPTPLYATRTLTRSVPDSASVGALHDFREALEFRRFEVLPSRANADARHGRAVLRFARRARRGRVRAVARVPATPRRVERPHEPGRRARRQAGDEMDGTPAVPRGAQRSRARSVQIRVARVAGTEPPDVWRAVASTRALGAACLSSPDFRETVFRPARRTENETRAEDPHPSTKKTSIRGRPRVPLTRSVPRRFASTLRLDASSRRFARERLISTHRFPRVSTRRFGGSAPRRGAPPPNPNRRRRGGSAASRSGSPSSPSRVPPSSARLWWCLARRGRAARIPWPPSRRGPGAPSGRRARCGTRPGTR